jgi:hypothetical protein
MDWDDRRPPNPVARAAQILNAALRCRADRMTVSFPARAEFRSWPVQVLLCTDLHAENILAAQWTPWLAIERQWPRTSKNSSRRLRAS